MGDDLLVETSLELSDEAVEGAGKLANITPTENFQRIVSQICSSSMTHVDNYRGPGLASPLNESIVCNKELFDKVVANSKNWSDSASDGFKELIKTGVEDKILSDILVKYVDDVSQSDKVLTVFGTDPQKAAKLLNKYGDDAVELVARYGDDGFEALARFKSKNIFCEIRG